MKSASFVLGLGLVVVIGACALALSQGASQVDLSDVCSALSAFDDRSYAHFTILYQRLPQIGIAATVGASLAVSGVVLQGLFRNPLAAPSVLGMSSGAALFVVAFGFLAGTPMVWHGPIAFVGGVFGFGSALAMARLAGGKSDPRGLSLILSGALVSMLYGALSQAILLTSPDLRAEVLSWVTGNVNFAYADRLAVMAPLASVSLAGLWLLSRQVTLLTLSSETAAAVGVSSTAIWWMSLTLVAVATSAAVAICGPIGFVGLVVPHMLRPFVGADMRRAIPANALFGAAFLVMADLGARSLFAPKLVHTGVAMNLLGGVVFIWLVRRVYLTGEGGRPSFAGGRG